jgi:hypothetical protein
VRAVTPFDRRAFLRAGTALAALPLVAPRLAQAAATRAFALEANADEAALVGWARANAWISSSTSSGRPASAST